MPSGSITSPRRSASRRYSRRRRGPRRQRELYPLRKFVLAYLAAISVWIGSQFLFVSAFGVGTFLLSCFIYCVCGYTVTRYISLRVVYNSNFATIASVAEAKLGTVLWWPIAVPVFIWQVFVARYF